MNIDVINIIIGGIIAIVMLCSILALIGWFKNKGRRSLPLTYRIKNRWYHELIKIPTTIFYTWGNRRFDIDWLNWELGVGKLNSNSGFPYPTLGDYIFVLGKWNQIIVLVITDVNRQTHQIETCALGYLNEQKPRS